MEVIGIWLSPLLLLPGAALLILSTSNRLNRLHDEVHHQIDEKHSLKRNDQSTSYESKIF